MNNFNRMQELLKEKSDLKTRINQIPVDGSLEVKTIDGEQYIYQRKRVAGKHTSTYIGKYDETFYLSLQRQLQELRQLKKSLRQIEKKLAEAGYEEKELSSRIILNMDFARSNIKSLIYDQAVLEGITATFPQTEEILDNGTVSGVTASDVQKILNLKRAWELILDRDVLSSQSNYYLLSSIARIINEGFYTFGGNIRSTPVRIGGSTYLPPLPFEQDVKEDIHRIHESNQTVIEKAIDIVLYCMKTQIFIDGNKRAAIIFANHYLISHGQGLLVVPEDKVSEFRRLLIDYYEEIDLSRIREFFMSYCWLTF